jgi:hypothetical protein
MFAALSALLALKEQNLPRARAVILIEACEESGSYDLPFYVEHLAGRIGETSLVICLDSGCGDYERLWLTTSLRGNVAGVLSIRVLTEGVHSGSASGIGLPSTRMSCAPESASAGLVSTLPSTVTRPSDIQRSASRREHKPARARSLAMRSPFAAASAMALSAARRR